MSAKSTIAASALDASGPEWHVAIDRLFDHRSTDLTLEVRGATAAQCTVTVQQHATVEVTMPAPTWWALVRACAAARATRGAEGVGLPSDWLGDASDAAWAALADLAEEGRRVEWALLTERCASDLGCLRQALRRAVTRGGDPLAELVGEALASADGHAGLRALTARPVAERSRDVERAAPLVAALRRVWGDATAAAADWLLQAPVIPGDPRVGRSPLDRLRVGDVDRVLAALTAFAERRGEAQP